LAAKPSRKPATRLNARNSWHNKAQARIQTNTEQLQ